jgi:Ca2+-binding EF-hand superfamily protein
MNKFSQNLNQFIFSEKIARLISQMDHDKDGTIDQDEFANFLAASSDPKYVGI